MSRAPRERGERGCVGVVARRGRLHRRRAVLRARPRRSPLIARGTATSAPATWCSSRPRGAARAHGSCATLGPPDVARDVVEALLADRGLRARLRERVEAEARAAVAEPPATAARRDLTALPTFTIDPASARDFDDAISAERDGDGCGSTSTSPTSPPTCDPGTALDAEAHARGNSVYVPGTVEPMLPRALSSDACSLVPGRRAARRHGRDRARARRRPCARPRSTAARSAPTRGSPTSRSTRSSPARSRPPEAIAEPLALARRAAGAARRRARRSARSGSRRPSPSSSSTPRARSSAPTSSSRPRPTG